MHERRHARVGEDLGERRGMILMRMHAARRHQADEMASAAALLELLDQVDKRRCAPDLAAGDGAADARQVLQDDASRPDVEMADF